MVIVKCDNCGNDVSRQPHELENNNNNFCDKQCYDEFQTEFLEKNCPNCNNSFKTKKYDENKFCSSECYNKSKNGKTKVNCNVCNDTVEYYNHRIKKQENFYCSQECRSKQLSDNWKGKNNPNYKDGVYDNFGSNWKKAQRQVRNRARGMCEGCGKSKKLNGRKLDIHHIIPRYYFIESEKHCVEDSNKMNNLVALCQSCHAKEEPVCRNVLENIILQ